MMKIILFSATLFVATFAHKDGAPRSVCDSLTPHHGHKYHPQPNSPPYELVISQKTLQGGQTTNVTLRTKYPEVAFKGFLVQGRDSASGEPIGKFTVLSEFSDISQLLDCSQRGDSVTHRRIEGHVGSVTFGWTAPKDYTGKVKFHWTVVKTTKKFWADLVEEDAVTVE